MERSGLARSLDGSLIALVVAGVLLALVQLTALPLGGPPGALPALFPAIFLVYVGAGTLAWYRRPSNRMGALILFAGATIYVAGMVNAASPALEAVGTVAATVPLAATIHLLLAFPSGRLHPRAAVVIVIAGYTTAVVLRAPVYLFDPSGPDPDLVVGDDPALARAGLVVQGLAGAAVLIAAAVLLSRRLAAATPAHRRVLAPVYAYGIAAVLVLALSGNLLGRVLEWPATVVAVIQLVVVAGIPIAFVLGILSGGFARTGQLEELAAWLGSAGGADRRALTAALGATIGDPTVEIAYWVPQRKAYVDAEGRPASIPPPQLDHDPQLAPRASAEVELRGRPIAAIVYDPDLIDDPDAVRAAGRVVAIALERERLIAELRASRRALQRSRERLVDADDRGRRRLAQDLHDGLQVQLVLLAIEAQQLALSATRPEEAQPATRLREGIDGAAAELRRLVQSVMPAALVERGLAAAVDDLADRMPIPTAVQIDLGGSCPEAVERTAYFVVAESLTNAVKYARATTASVGIARIDAALRVDVRDDGVGGATAGEGAGMRGLADRVDVLGGTMQVDSKPGEGTHIMVELPCGS